LDRDTESRAFSRSQKFVLRSAKGPGRRSAPSAGAARRRARGAPAFASGAPSREAGKAAPLTSPHIMFLSLYETYKFAPLSPASPSPLPPRGK